MNRREFGIRHDPQVDAANFSAQRHPALEDRNRRFCKGCRIHLLGPSTAPNLANAPRTQFLASLARGARSAPAWYAFWYEFDRHRGVWRAISSPVRFADRERIPARGRVSIGT